MFKYPVIIFEGIEASGKSEAFEEWKIPKWMG